jgi:hypothetical protein
MPETTEIRTITLNSDVLSMQCNVTDDFHLYSYMDFNTKKFVTMYDDEKVVKLNVEKLAKKRLQISKFWEEVQDVRFEVDFQKEEFKLHYYLN